MGQGAGNAVKFDSTGFIGILHGSIPPSGNFSVESWVYGTYITGQSHREFLSQKDSTLGNGRNFYIGYQLADSSIRAGDYWQNTTVKFPFNTWNHITVVKDTPYTYLYINGILKNTSSLPFKNPRQNDSLFFGRQWDGNEKWKGNLDEVRIWNTALSQTTIQQWINKSVTASHPNFANLKGYWKFDEGSGTTTADASGNGNTGTLVNGPTWITSTAPVNLPQLAGEYTPDANTVLLMHFNEDSTSFVGDVSENSNHGVATGTTTVTGKYGKARSFNGTGEHLLFGSNQIPLGNSSRTVEAWIKNSTPISTIGQVILDYGSGNNNQRFCIMILSGKLFFSGYANDLSGTRNIIDGLWHHVAATHNGSRVELFVDGVLDASLNTTLNTSSVAYKIGRRMDDNATENFNGLIDEVRISNKARQPWEFNTAVVYYPFNGNANDESGNGNNGTNNGATPTTDRFGNANSAYSFNGTSDYIDLGQRNDFTWKTNSIGTFECWIFPTSLSALRFIFSVSHNTNQNCGGRFHIGIDSNRFFYEVGQGTGDCNLANRYTVVSTLSTGQWYHLAVSYDGTNLKMYINSIVQSYSQSGPPPGTPWFHALDDGITQVGTIAAKTYQGTSRTDNFSGIVDDIRIYDRALSSNEVDSLYHLNGWETNTAPVAHDTTVTTNEDTPKSITLTATDAEDGGFFSKREIVIPAKAGNHNSKPGMDSRLRGKDKERGNDNNVMVSSLSFSIIDSTNYGIITGTPPNVTYTPATNYNGNDTLLFRVSDGLLSDTGTVAISVTPVNDVPIAIDTSITTNEDVAKTGNVRATDVDNASLTYFVVTNGTKGSVAITNANTGAFTYTPSLNQNGSDVFTFRAFDGFLNDTGTVNVTINAVNDAPIAKDTSISTDEDVSKAIVVQGNDSFDTKTLTFALVASPLHGTLTGEMPNLTYFPAPNYFGNDNFKFSVNDGELLDTGTVSITVNTVNDKPIARDTSITLNENTSKSIILPASDVDNITLSFSIITNPSHGTVTNEEGNLFFYQTQNYSGADTFVFQSSDGTLKDTGRVFITINSVNDAPIATSLSDSIQKNRSKTITLTGQDPEGGSVTFFLDDQPLNGTIRNFNSTTGEVLYRPDYAFVGLDSFSFYCRDSLNALSNTAWCIITVYQKIDSTSFRSFSQSDLTTLAVKKPKKGVRPLPTTGNVLDTLFINGLFKKLKDKTNPNFPGGMVLGVSQSSKDSTKKYGWIRLIGKSKDVQKGLTQTSSPRGFDVFKNNKAFTKELKNPKTDKYSNQLAGELLALKVNIAASEQKITNEGFGNLVYDNPLQQDTFVTQRFIIQGKTLSQIARDVDTMLTYYKRYYTATTPSEEYSKLTTAILSVNEAFRSALDTISWSPLQLTSDVRIDGIEFLKRGSGKEMLFVESEFASSVPEEVMLLQNYPNPFNPTTTIRFEVEGLGLVSLQVFDVLGREVATLLNNEAMEEGEHEIQFDASGLTSGVYFYRISVGQDGILSYTETKKLLLMK
ncbi:MAG: tandem-95 repeat protein [Ignavibacteriales bacterium]|nr:tandem-95 repeat protein [Ignavibacteriales bacterium]